MMKALLCSVALLLCVPVYSAEPEAPVKDGAPVPAKSATPTMAATRDAFLAFALEKAKDYSGKAEAVVSKAVDAATTEAPVLAREFLVWRFWKHTLSALWPVLLFGGGLWLGLFHWPRYRFGGYGDRLVQGHELNVAGFIIGAIGTVVGFVTFVVNGMSELLLALQVQVAPRVYVVEQVLNLFK